MIAGYALPGVKVLKVPDPFITINVTMYLEEHGFDADPEAIEAVIDRVLSTLDIESQVVTATGGVPPWQAEGGEA